MNRTAEEMAGELMRGALRRDPSLTRADLVAVVGDILKAHPKERYSIYDAEKLSAQLGPHLILARMGKIRREVCGDGQGPAVEKRKGTIKPMRAPVPLPAPAPIPALPPVPAPRVLFSVRRHSRTKVTITARRAS
jgi:hypothetical protein